MDAYLSAVDAKTENNSAAKAEGTHKPDGTHEPGTTPPDTVVQPCEQAQLIVSVTNFKNIAISGVIVTVDGLGEKSTDPSGNADYGYVNPGHYHATAKKEGIPSLARRRPERRVVLAQVLPPQNFRELAEPAVFPRGEVGAADSGA